MKTFILEFKSGRIQRIFANSKEDLSSMVTIELVKKITEIE